MTSTAATSPALEPALAEAITSVCETALFRIVEPVPGGRAARALLEATIEFEGPTRGCLRLWLEQADAPALARAFLGLGDDDALAEDEVRDVVGELANTVCGGVVARMDPAAVWRLGSPRVRAADAASSERAGAAPVRLWADPGLLLGEIRCSQ